MNKVRINARHSVNRHESNETRPCRTMFFRETLYSAYAHSNHLYPSSVERTGPG